MEKGTRKVALSDDAKKANAAKRQADKKADYEASRGIDAAHAELIKGKADEIIARRKSVADRHAAKDEPKVEASDDLAGGDVQRFIKMFSGEVSMFCCVVNITPPPKF